MRAVGRLERGADASAAEPSTRKQDHKASCQTQPHDKEPSRIHEYNLSSVNQALV